MENIPVGPREFDTWCLKVCDAKKSDDVLSLAIKGE